MKEPIVVVAPYSPVGSCEAPHLGAASKIAAILRILARFGRPLILVNSAHNLRSFRRTTDVTEGTQRTLTPFTVPVRPIGKLLNLLAARVYARRLASLRPALVWVYNGYAFEGRLALELAARTGCPLVMEIEDLPLARSRGVNPKPWLDRRYFRLLQHRAALLTCVNQSIYDDLTGTNRMLLPSILSPYLAARAGREPFSQPPYRVGYFGGLTIEKGVNRVLELVAELPTGWTMVVTGMGPLAAQVAHAAAASAGRLQFLEGASEAELYAAMGTCDVILNPHQPIAEMQQGVFPFKVFEAIASGRLLISTPLPAAGLPLEGGVRFYDGSLEGLRQALLEAPRFHADRRAHILQLATLVRSQYEEEAVFAKLQVALGHTLASS